MILRVIPACLITFALSACTVAPATSKAINSSAIAQLGPYSHAVKAGEFVFVSGMIAHDKATGFAAAEIEPQTHQVFANLIAALNAADLTLENVVKTTIFLKNPADFSGMNEVYSEYFPNDPPARTTVPGVDWGRSDILIEIEAIAYHPE